MLLSSHCDGKDLYYAFFNWNTSAEMRDDFEAEIMKVENRVKI